jgi:two-component system, NtrC family, sensor histidine kinase PilS
LQRAQLVVPDDAVPDPRRQPILDPHRILRSVYVGRLTMVAAIFVAAVLAWKNADAALTLVVSLMFIVALAFTAGSALYTIVYKSPLRSAFLYTQSLFDLVVVTAIVHVTGGGSSQFAALYILVIAAASLLLPVSGGLMIAALGCVLYFSDVILTPGMQLDLGVWLQLSVFAAVALGSAFIRGAASPGRGGNGAVGRGAREGSPPGS